MEPRRVIHVLLVAFVIAAGGFVSAQAPQISTMQRVQARQMLRDWERQYPGRADNLLKAMGNVVPSHLMDRNLYPFATLQASDVADAQGDKAFDDDLDAEACGSPLVVKLAPSID